jgi:hypothetical protein
MITAWQAICRTAAGSARACGDSRAGVFALVRLASCHLGQGHAEAALGISGQAIRTAWAGPADPHAARPRPSRAGTRATAVRAADWLRARKASAALVRA